MAPQPTETREKNSFQSHPKPTQTTSATLKRELLNMTPKDLRDLLSELGVNIKIKEEGGDDYKDEASRDYYQQKMPFANVNLNQGAVFSNSTKMSTLSSGLILQTKSCSDMELGSARVVIAKGKHGNNLLNRQKIKKIVTIALNPAIARSNIAKICLTTDVDSYKVAEGATQWSTSVKAIH
jgi:hypothetical protein